MSDIRSRVFAVPAATRTPLATYLRAMRSHPFVLLAVILTTVVIAGALLVLNGKTYEATARVLVTPLPSGDRSLIGLPLPRNIGDPGRSVETAASLIEGSAATVAAAGDSAIDFRLSSVEVVPQETSNIVEIVASASSPERAAEIANDYTTAALDQRAQALEDLIDETVGATEAQLAVASDPERRAVLETRLVDLALLGEGVDPTLSLAQAASPPTSPAGSPRSIVLIVAAIAGFALGSVACLLIELLVTRRLRDEADVVRAYPLPVLARLPGRRARRRTAGSGEEPAAVVEGYRRLRTQLELRPRIQKGAATIAVLGGVRDDRNGEVAAGLAAAVEKKGESAVVLDLDPAELSVAARLGGGDPGAPLDAQGGARVRVVAAPPPADLAAEERLFVDARATLQQERKAADWVIVRPPPTSERSDLLTIVDACDHVVVVSRLGRARSDVLATLRELLETAGVQPAGHVLIGQRRDGYGDSGA